MTGRKGGSNWLQNAGPQKPRAICNCKKSRFEASRQNVKDIDASVSFHQAFEISCLTLDSLDCSDGLHRDSGRLS